MRKRIESRFSITGGVERIAKRASTREQAFEAVDDALVQSVRKRQSAGGAPVAISVRKSRCPDNPWNARQSAE